MSTNLFDIPLPETDWEKGDDAFPATEASLSGDRRTEARVCAVQVLFAARKMNEPVDEVAAEFLADVKARKADAALFAEIVAEAGEGAVRYRELIGAHMLDEWPLERLDPVLYALLWAACAELSVRPDLPVKVVVNEFLNIAKGFASKPAEVGFVHVVLDRVAGKIRGV
ncbi:MAG: transcription antitermination factor NusB [Pseudomonadaceae bacterium]|nr:transcription antitermination factor NusB [Pseudomonadaceae bacterium]